MCPKEIPAGGYGDVWKGIYEDRAVAIKTLRIDSTVNLDQAKKVFFLAIYLSGGPRLNLCRTTGLL